MTASTRDTAPRMTAASILEVVEAERSSLQRLGVRTLGLFGSFRRGTAHSRSDLDFLVTFEQPSFRAYMETKALLEGRFHRKVDLVLEENLKPRLRPHILQEAVYAAGLSPLPR
jgi:uncharacterized protein